ADELKEIDEDLYNEYKETITFLEGISEEEYQNIKNEIIESVKEFIKNER
ncbi:TPA: transcriptional regulator, partial [Streptococcus pneumoniae]|nr:transcriptional regulator [Streptococcus pneumoniae]